MPGPDLLRFAEWINTKARETIIEDGTHAAMFFLIARDGRMSGRLFDAIEERPVIDRRARELGEAVARCGAVAAAFVSEAWVALPEGIPHGGAAGDAPSSRDALIVAAADSVSFVAFTTPVIRSPDGSVDLGESVRLGAAPEVDVFRLAREFWRSPDSVQATLTNAD
jgi:hypothetical protein